MEQKTVLLGVTGCIAAYKACEIIRGLQKAGVRVKVVMTSNATHFVGPATFKGLTREPVAVSLFDAPGDPIHHISLAKEADLFLVAPATANVISKLAHGTADDLLTTTALATTAPLLIAPAMNVAMWRAEATRENITTLRARGVEFVDPVAGRLACGDEGEGKLADVEEIVARALEALVRSSDFEGKKVLVTAGPTYEPLDPVRFLGNHSSGKMGYALAKAAAGRNAQVTLVSGPVALPDPLGVTVIHVQTAEEMLDACRTPFEDADIAIFTAAVADFKPAHVAAEKIKKDQGAPMIELVPNPDILKTLAAHKKDTFVVGFAAETENVLEAAKNKLAAKNADLIVANDVSMPGLGFGADTNKVWLVSKDGVQELDVMSKTAIANRILDVACQSD
ncbi:MAG: bifunctional phosphopantothenoylcysteine decarboxylase/phosphopantothenate--cysteine ligase CoaBC [Actinobacteria bacterium]|nr:bifunctional phosphopantothenoylcysteine decarboxylase/phosphopantothenate--cysteine ligase CoaBC [Actinomycetota bacterium]